MSPSSRSSLSCLSLVSVLGCAVAAVTGCELIATVDRSQIPDASGPGAGGNGDAGGAAATGGSSSGGSDAAGGGGATAGEGGAANEGGGANGGAGASGGEGGAAGAGGSDASGGSGMAGQGGGAGETGAGGEPNGPAGKIIFLSSTPKKANFGGVAGADAHCNASPPKAGTYKALLVDGSTRVACTSASCATDGVAEGVDWVLAANTTYVRADGTTVIGTTSAAAIFEFPLTASIGTGAFSYWTGLSSDWTTSEDTCNGWTETSDVFASEGLADATDDRAIAGVSESCATLAGAFFACVEQ
jgi:Protein of unknown function (DUF1554)